MAFEIGDPAEASGRRWARASSRLIDAQPELELAEACEDYDSLIRAIESHRPDVVLTDIRMPPTGTNEGIRAAEHLR